MTGLAQFARSLLGRASPRLEDKPRPEPEAVNAQARTVTGFFAGLTPEQKERALAYRGPDSFGDPG